MQRLHRRSRTIITFNIFYDSTKNIKWCCGGSVDSATISGQAAIGLSYLQLDLEQIPACDHWYINDAEDGVVAYHEFDLTFSATMVALDGIITITGCPTGTEIFMDTVSVGTYSSGALTLTGTMAGSFRFKFTKDKYYDVHQIITIKRYT